jgi:hypothetical protein
VANALTSSTNLDSSTHSFSPPFPTLHQVCHDLPFILFKPRGCLWSSLLAWHPCRAGRLLPVPGSCPLVCLLRHSRSFPHHAAHPSPSPPLPPIPHLCSDPRALPIALLLGDYPAHITLRAPLARTIRVGSQLQHPPEHHHARAADSGRLVGVEVEEGREKGGC